MRRRLYLQIYGAFVAVAVFAVAITGLAARLVREPMELPEPAIALAGLVAEALPGPGGGPEEVQSGVEALAGRLHASVSIWDAGGRVIAAAGDELPAPRPEGTRGLLVHTWRGPSVAVQLDDGRWLGLGMRWARRGPRWHGIVLVALAGAMAIGCYPVARRITRRIEALQQGVDAWGQGDLARRVPVEGMDEVSRLAASFNASADRVSRLVEAQRRVLASASHDLRSPLARLRMALELLDDGTPEKRSVVLGAARDVGELDDLVGDLLLSSRVEAMDRLESPESVDLLGILAEEAVRLGAEASGESAMIRGDPRLLRRMVRNLLENGRKHGGGAFDARVVAGPPVRIVVEDRGPGVPEAERERIFEPFYRPGGHREGGGGGVGLGLALVRQIAAHHGARAWVEPRDGGGSRFVVEFGS